MSRICIFTCKCCHLFVFLYLFLDLPILFAGLLILVPLLSLAATPHRLQHLDITL